MKGIVGLAAEAGAWILADEVYQGAELSGVRTPSFWGLWEKTLVVNGLSKAYGLPGLRVGWIVGPEEVVKTDLAVSRLHDHLALGPERPAGHDRPLPGKEGADPRTDAGDPQRQLPRPREVAQGPRRPVHASSRPGPGRSSSSGTRSRSPRSSSSSG